ncbi:hypothetical protein RclHR1_11130005 [Rhizophagus clarus]|nr:hypothetical protein RclHR1_11130005 [Rhizophagus clarus]
MVTPSRTEVNRKVLTDVHIKVPTMEREYVKDILPGHVVHQQDHNIYPLIKFLLCTLVIAEQIRRIENFSKDSLINTTSLQCSSNFFQQHSNSNKAILAPLLTIPMGYGHLSVYNTPTVITEKITS